MLPNKKRINYVAWEFLKGKSPANPIGSFNSITELENVISEIYSIQYKNEPAYPYIIVQLEDVNELGHRNSIVYCYYGRKLEFK